MVRFLCEIFRRTEYPPEKAIAAAAIIDNEGRKVSMISTAAHPTTGYWIDWGGTYDTPTTNLIVLYFDGFLSLVSSIAQMILAGMAMYRGTDVIYFATDLYPWQYPESQTETLEGEGYSTAVSNPKQQSNDVLALRRYPVKMQIPSLKIKIPDAVSGSALQLSAFNVSLFNDDGTFDLTESNNFFNTPLYVLKSFIDNPVYSDYEIIRRGLIDDFDVNFGKFGIKVATTFRSLSEDVHKIINITDYPSAPSDNIGKKIPLVWGAYDNIDVIEVATNTFVIIDPDYIVSIDKVYDEDGLVISSGNYSLVNGLLVMTSGTPATADVTGSADNKIGEIITDEIQNKGKILYSSDLWDITETDAYISGCASLNLFFEGGSVRELVVEVLKSDNAFLIEKSDGRLSIRKWGGSYTTHLIDSWTITKQPAKKFVDSKYYTTTARITYPGGIYEDDSQEETIAEIFRKKQTREFKTSLSSSSEAQILATDLLNRYGQRAEIWKVPLGINTNEISLLDKVTMDLIVNNRKLSNKNSFLVTAIDVAQDVLTLEAIGTVTISSGILSTPSGIGYEGDMSGGFESGGTTIMAEILKREDT